MAVQTPTSTPYKETLTAKPAQFCQPPQKGALVVPLQIDWSKYTATGGVYVDLSSIPAQNGNGIDFIKSLRVDNSRVNAAITIFFPDTQWSAVVAPQEIKTITVVTNQNKFYVSTSDTTATGITNISVVNTVIPDYETTNEILGLASPDTTNTLPSPVFRAFATGDASYGFFLDLSTVVDNTTTQILPNATGGHYIITDLQLTTMRLRCYTGNTLFKWTFTNWTNPGLAPVGFINVPSDRTAFNTQVHFSLKGQLLLDATQGFSINFPTGFFGTHAGAVIRGALIVNFSFTQTAQ